LISSIKDEEGKVIAYVCWKQVGKSGFEKFQGEYVYLEDLWIHDAYRGKGLLQRLIADVLEKAPEAQYGYFTREKYGHRMSKLFKRSSVERIANVFVK